MQKSPTLFQSETVRLLSFIARVQTINSQGLVSSAIGETLYPIYSLMTGGLIGGTLDRTEVYLWSSLQRRASALKTTHIDLTLLHSSFALVLWQWLVSSIVF
ncbi:hypothetical protein BDR07DRAFT_571644 [Suillus spraguei]|nr:hypothetical protein BDR07DRAFT_571644 [Suillus spraguei]